MQHEISDEVVSLVDSLLEMGCDMWAIKTGYVMNEPSNEPLASVAQTLLEDFGPRSHLREQISTYLRSLGRSFDDDLL